MDTLDVEGDKCIELSFIPQNPQDLSGETLSGQPAAPFKCELYQQFSDRTGFLHAPERPTGIGEGQYDCRTGRIEEIP